MATLLLEEPKLAIPAPAIDLPLLCFNQAMALDAEGRFEDAAEKLRRAIELKPDFFEAQANLANIYRRLGKHKEALKHFFAALRLNPDCGAVYSNLGLLCRETNLLDQSIKYLNLAIEHHFAGPEVYSEFSCIMIALQRFEEAETYLRLAIDLKLDQSQADALASTLSFNRGDYAQAEKDLDTIFKRNPNHSSAHMIKSTLLLIKGDFDRGWQEYEWRLKDGSAKVVKGINLLDLPYPFWNGRPLTDKTILVQAEQGNGDVIQFIRYLPLVKERAGRVIFSCPKSLIGLLKNCAGADLVVDREDVAGLDLAIDVQIPLMSLPGIFKTEIDTIPANVPYLKVDSDRKKKWAERLGREKGFKVGIVWAGNPKNSNDKRRSCALSHFIPLSKISGVTLFSLQKGGEAEEQVKSLPADAEIINLADELKDFADTAAAIENLDLIISVDTAVAHLAGALGRPVWTLLSFVNCWRWLFKREDSPWYPSMRLFRQTGNGQWAGLFTRISQDLGAIIKIK